MARTVFLMTAYKPLDADTISLQLDDRWFHIPPMEPFEVDSEFYANKLLEIYGVNYGLIEVPTSKTRTGVSFNIESAEKLALAELDRTEKILLDAYVRDQRDNRVRHNYPCLPPSGRVAEIIQSRKIDLKAKYNLDVLGMEPIQDEDKAKLQQENADLRNRLDAQDAKLDQLIEAMTTSAGKKG